MIRILDIGFGNINSLKSWLYNSQLEFSTISKPEINLSDTLLVPGIGKADFAMSELKRTRFIKPIKDHIKLGGRYVGICVGMQILFEHLEEGNCSGFGVFRGSVCKISEKSNTCWSNLTIERETMTSSWHKGLGKKTKLSGRVFNNHTYGAINEGKEMGTFKVLDENSRFIQIVGNKNVLGFQFHPEKSQQLGKKISQFLIK